jgi:hypothetical protein
MTCKNCHTHLRLEYRFCPGCGAKTEVRRITFKALAKDFIDRVFDLDNSVVRTFTGLFVKPEAVIGGYLSGLRKRYLNPVSYLGIALTLSGVIMFLIQRFFKENIDFTGGVKGANPEFSAKWADLVFDFNALFFLAFLPMLALPAYLIMNKVRYNLAEYTVAFIYVLAHFSIVSFPVALISLLIDPNQYLAVNQPLQGLMFIYCLFVLWRLNRYRAGAFAGRSLVYLMMAAILFVVFIMGLVVVLFATGVFQLSDFKPPEA